MADAVKTISEYQRFGSVLGLERITELLKRLGNPEKNLRVIHVAGTNGKGSVCRYVYEALQATGYRCGLFISPFIEKFNERIEYDGKYISDNDLALMTGQVIKAAKEMEADGFDSPTEFEIITAIAFAYFHYVGCDLAVLEVGLGGRGDSTNVISSPLVSIITSISLDHTERLGDTIEKIAGEKAGIIKAGCPVVTAAEHSDAKTVFEKTAKEHHSLWLDASLSNFHILKSDIHGSEFSVDIQGVTYEKIKISMVGLHQVKNAVAALTALTLLGKEGKIHIAEKDILQGFARAKQPGRMEVMLTNPYIILDGAHNPDGAAALKKAIQQNFDHKRILMVVGILADKDVDKIIDAFLDITENIVVTEPNNPRKLSADTLTEKINKLGGKAVSKELALDAVRFALSKRDEWDLILFAGSLYLIGEIRGILRDEIKDKESHSIL